MAQLNDLVVTGKSRFLNTIGGTIEKSEQVKVSKTSSVNTYGLLFSEFPSGTSDYSDIHINEFITVDPTPANLYVRRSNSNGFSLHAEGGTGVNYIGLSSGSNGGLEFYGYKQGNTNSPDIKMTGGSWDGSNDSLVTAVTSAKDTVKQNVLSTASTNSYKLLLSGSADTSAHTEGVYKYSTLEFTPDNNESVLDGNTLSMYNNSWETVIRLSCGTSPYLYVKDSSPKYLKAYNTDIVLGDWNGTSNTWDGTNTSLKTALAGKMTNQVQSAQISISCLKSNMMMYKCGRIVYFSIIADFNSTGLASRVTTNVGSITAADWKPIALSDSGLAGFNSQISMSIKTDGTITMYNYTTAAISTGWFRWSGCYITAS